jgi:ligand-binding SRPBCC domain-containing protein
MGYSHHTEQWLPCPVEAVFAFFADPDNLPALLPAWQQARIEKVSLVSASNPANPEPPIPGTTAYAGSGTRLTLSFRPFRHFPLRLRWVAEITEFSWNDRFCDRQVRGPFAWWCHCHRFRAVDRQGMDMTVVVDHVEYELPLGFLGRLAHHFFLRRRIEDMFSFRQAQLAQVFARMPPGSLRPQPQQERRSA